MEINWPVFGATVLPNLGGIAGSVITRRNLSPWYESLKRPSWQPPNCAFGPVWGGVYSGIGYASYLVYRDCGGFTEEAKLPLIAYGANLALNWAWTPIFFGCHNLKWAFYEINLLNASAIGTAYLFYKVNTHAGYLMIPYVLWLSFATALSYVIYRDNDGSNEENKEGKVEIKEL